MWCHLDPGRTLSSVNQGSWGKWTGESPYSCICHGAWKVWSTTGPALSPQVRLQASVFLCLHYRNTVESTVTVLAMRTSLLMQSLKWDSLHWTSGKPCSVHREKHLSSLSGLFQDPAIAQLFKFCGKCVCAMGRERGCDMLSGLPWQADTCVFLQNTITSCLSNYTLKMHLLLPEYSFPQVGEWHTRPQANLQPVLSWKTCLLLKTAELVGGRITTSLISFPFWILSLSLPFLLLSPPHLHLQLPQAGSPNLSWLTSVKPPSP